MSVTVEEAAEAVVAEVVDNELVELVDAVVSVEVPLPPGLFWFPDPGLVNDTEQDWTSCTAGLPLASVIGVSVTVHVWVIAPTTV